MESMFILLALVLGVASALTMASIVSDVLPKLNQEERVSLRDWGTFSLRRVVKRNRAIRNAWNLHVLLFPKSRKRVLFACLLIGMLLSVICYPLWLAIGPR
jgi:hypothetical protein